VNVVEDVVVLVVVDDVVEVLESVVEVVVVSEGHQLGGDVVVSVVEVEFSRVVVVNVSVVVVVVLHLVVLVQ